MNLQIRRLWHDGERTLGELWVDGSLFAYTLEPGFLDSKEPIVPAGNYRLVRHDGPKYKDTWALVGNGVTHQPGKDSKRSAILIHAGNRDDDTRGCIIIGLRIGILLGETSVLMSGVAMNKLRSVLKNQEHDLEILEVRHG